MDEYGILQVTKEDAMTVREAIRITGSCVFSLNTSESTAQIFLVSTRFIKLGLMPWGGNPDGRFFVGAMKIGCAHFGPRDTHPSYIEEKLGLCEEDAHAFAEFWKLIWKELPNGKSE